VAYEKFHAWVYDLKTVGGESDVTVAMPNEPYKIKWAGTSTLIASGNTDSNGLIEEDLGAGRKIVDIYINDVLRLSGCSHFGAEYG